MNVVIYTEDFEPITVIDLPVWLLDQLERQGAVRVAIQDPPSLKPPTEPPEFQQPKIVEIYCEKLRWKDGTVKPILITYDEELALMMKPDWLPGQRGAVNSYKQVVRGLTDQLIKAMRK